MRAIPLILASLLTAGAPPSDTALPRNEAPPPRTSPADTARALHLLSRATFGPTPGALAEVLRTGPEAWLDRQLHPERIDDRALEGRLARFPAAGMRPAELIRAFPPPRLQRQARSADSLSGRGAPRPELRRRVPGASPNRILADLAGAKLQRAVYSERQLEEVMADFWFNHFNVFFGKNADRWLVGDYERTAIRPHVFGRFEEMLAATASHPAMLVYLDNATSAVPDSLRDVPARPRRPRGINENYARELLELHTLGVDGGYTQRDVVEVARAFTGWTLSQPPAAVYRTGGEVGFAFRPALHDRGEKTVLGRRLPAGRGIEDGREVLRILAHHPSTARHIARKLAERFVADEPPAALVDRLAAVFLRTGGDLREVTRALFLAPEFGAAVHRRAKVKTPFEFVASAFRATGAEVGPSRATLQALRSFGHLPYMSTAPTGYPHTSAEWTNGGAMLNRMNFALALAAGRIDGVRVDPALLEEEEVATLAHRVLPGMRGERLLETIRADLAGQAASQGEVRARRALGLLVGSPDFQRR
ncbi:MAG TPA: DUF1800 domain-containing protein [Longimicrobiaceae bacterium]|nr:DUF1800 domain-containing protein [Longimicrobiaceae bacterium]